LKRKIEFIKTSKTQKKKKTKKRTKLKQRREPNDDK